MGAKIRPGFEMRVGLPRAAVLEALHARLRESDCPVSGLVAPGRIELHVHGPEQHLWSPQLIVDVEEREGEALLHARFGPHPSVWTMYVAGYAACVFIAFVGSSFAFAQLAMGHTPWALVSLLVSGGVALFLYLLALLGQGLGEEQMTQLRAFLEQTLQGRKREAPTAPAVPEAPIRAAS